jgi:hypothetical protein
MNDHARTLGARLLASRTLAADCLGADFPAPPPDALDKPLGFAWTTRDACTRRLVVDGRAIVEDGTLLTGDIHEIRAEAQAEATRLWRRMSEVAS